MMPRFVSTRQLLPLILLSLPAIAFGCSNDLTNADQEQIALPDAGSLWTGNEICNGCLQALCGDTDAGAGAYTGCKDQDNCRDAMAAFTTCFATKPALTDCSSQINSLKDTSSAGGQLLDCLLLKCYFTVCETIRPVTTR